MPEHQSTARGSALQNKADETIRSLVSIQTDANIHEVAQYLRSIERCLDAEQNERTYSELAHALNTADAFIVSSTLISHWRGDKA